ncbi:protein kinase [Planctomycetota bacterium]
MESEKKTIVAIFDAAIQIEDSTERETYVVNACVDDHRLLARIRALLKKHDINSFLDIPPVGADLQLDSAPITESPGTIIDRYKLLEKIGEGGMAVVYMAEQERPIRRKVALKIIKQGMDTQQVIARFEAERQALAMMDHPNIARVLDGGATETGRPYFVMDLVRGVSITDSCDRNELSINDRLDLFIQVCQAVQHAHQKGIIHRDIKPTNVMVAQQNGTLVPKVIDFGVAKAINQRLTEKTLFTRYAHIIGTPAYMSPEQAEFSNLDVDTRTDIYSLGILLYELLTGTPPFSEEHLRQAGYLEMQRVIREEEPIKPSTKLSTLSETMTDIAKQRDSTPELLRKMVRGDLDWIVMKSLEKDRTRRYETADALAQDVQRHLHHEPVQARNPGVVYRLQKCLRRHRKHALVALAGVVLMAAVIALLALRVQNQRQLSDAKALTHANILSQARESHAAGDPNAALKHLESILPSRHVAPEAQLLLATILVDERRGDEALPKLEGLLEERPAIAGAAHTLLARIIWEISTESSVDPVDHPEIDTHRQEAEALLPQTAEAYYLRATIALTIKEKLALLDQALWIDGSHYASRRLRGYTYYASRKYKQMERDAIAMTALHPDDPLGYSLWATALSKLNDDQGALAQYDRALGLTPQENPQHADLYAQRCDVLLRLGDYDRVLSDTQDCLDIFPEKTILHFYSFCALTALGRYEAAGALYDEELADSDTLYVLNFTLWSKKYVYDTLKAGRSWHPPDRAPEGIAYQSLLEAQQTFDHVSTMGSPIIAEGHSPDWSPDGTKLAFSLGVANYSGVAVYDLRSRETELLIVPGKKPKWSPDGRFVAFRRDPRMRRLSELMSAEREYWAPPQYYSGDWWIMEADGTGARYLARTGGHWSQDSKHLFGNSHAKQMLYSVAIDDKEAQPEPVVSAYYGIPVLSPNNEFAAIMTRYSLKILDLASGSFIHHWEDLSRLWNGNWAPSGRQFWVRSETGLWIFDLDTGQATNFPRYKGDSPSWSPDKTAFAFSLGKPFYEIWRVDLDPNISIIEMLGPALTLEETHQESVRSYTRKLEADPEDTTSILRRAYHYHCLHDPENVLADLDRYLKVVYPSALTNPQDYWFRDFLQGFWQSTPTDLGPTLNSAMQERVGPVSADGLSFYFTAGGRRPVTWDIFKTTRRSVSDPWGPPVKLGPPVNTEYGEQVTDLSVDGLSLYLSSDRPGGYGKHDLWVSTRESIDDPWGSPVNLGPKINSAHREGSLCFSSDGLELYVHVGGRPGGQGGPDLWRATRTTRQDDWSELNNLGPLVNGPRDDTSPCISPNGLLLFFSSWRSSGYETEAGELWVTTRPTTSDPWGAPVNLGPTINANRGNWEQIPRLTPDGSVLYFSTMDGRNSGLNMWQVAVPDTGKDER